MRKLFLISCVSCLLLVAGRGISAGLNTVQEKGKETEGQKPEFAVVLNHDFPAVLRLEDFLRQEFGDKVYIKETPKADFLKANEKTKPDFIEGVRAFYIYNTFSKPTEEGAFFNIVVVISSGQLERDFSMQSHKQRSLDGLIEWEHTMGVQMIAWIKKELELQKKVQQKSADNLGN